MTIDQIRERSRQYASGNPPLSLAEAKRRYRKLVSQQPKPEQSDESYRRECLAALAFPDPPAWLVDSLVSHFMRAHSRGVRASRLLGRKTALALFSDILSP
jgi:hypothetical protein